MDAVGILKCGGGVDMNCILSNAVKQQINYSFGDRPDIKTLILNNPSDMISVTYSTCKKINDDPTIIVNYKDEILDIYQRQINAKKKGNVYRAAANEQALTRRLMGPIAPYIQSHTEYDDPQHRAAAANHAAAAAYTQLTPRGPQLPLGNSNPGRKSRCPKGACSVMGGRRKTRRAKSRRAKTRRARRS